MSLLEAAISNFGNVATTTLREIWNLKPTHLLTPPLFVCNSIWSQHVSFPNCQSSFQIGESNERELFWVGSIVARSEDIRVWKPHGGICTGKEGSGERKSGFHWNQILWMLQAILLSLKLEVMNKRTSFANIHTTIDAKLAKFDKLIDARRRSMQAFKSDLASSQAPRCANWKAWVLVRGSSFLDIHW